MSSGARLLRVFVVLVSLVALVSQGAQVVVAPLATPLLYLFARQARPVARAGWAVLAALLMGELGWIVGYVQGNDESIAWVLGAALAVVTGLVVWGAGASDAEGAEPVDGGVVLPQ